MNSDLKNILEAVLLISESPVSIAKMQGLFDEDVQPATDEIKQAIESLQADCENRGVELQKIGSGYRYQTKVKYADWVRKLQAIRPPKMSRALLETLAIIAYRQPVTRGDIEEIRGVSVSADIIQKLQEREWVKQIGVRDVPGRPALFGTTPAFLSYFNLESLRELPSLMQERDLGEIARELETPLPPDILATLVKSEDQDVFSDVSLSGAKTQEQRDEDGGAGLTDEIEMNEATSIEGHLTTTVSAIDTEEVATMDDNTGSAASKRETARVEQPGPEESGESENGNDGGVLGS